MIECGLKQRKRMMREEKKKRRKKLGKRWVQVDFLLLGGNQCRVRKNPRSLNVAILGNSR